LIYNGISSIPKEFYDSDIRYCLEELNMNSNPLEELPPKTIKKLGKLKVVGLSYTKLKALPSDFGEIILNDEFE